MELAKKRDFVFGEIQKISSSMNLQPKYKDKILACTFEKFSKPLSLFEWKENSCFLDVVVAIILYCKYPFWRKKIYKFPKDDELVKGFSEISRYCKPLRFKLSKKEPKMGMYGFYEAVTTFEIIADHFGIKIPGSKELIIYSSDEIKKYPSHLVYSPIGLTESGKLTFVKKREFEKRYKLVAAIKNVSQHYVCFFESYEGVYYYDDLRKPVKVEQIPRGNYELEFYVRKDLTV